MNKYFFLLAFVIIIFSCERAFLPSEGSHSLPIVKVKVDEKYLWSSDSGLYLLGDNGDYNCEHVANYFQKWEFPANVKYYEKGKEIFSDNIGFRLKGNRSRENASKSLGIYWRKKYGTKDLDYPMFSEINTTSFKRLFLRSSSNDPSHMRDVLITDLIRDYANVDYQEYSPCALYLNKEYWGLYYIREMITPHHFENHYGVNADSVDLLLGNETAPEADDGSADAFLNEVIDFVRNNGMSSPENYAKISELIDIESYMDYVIINTYIDKLDWPGMNGKWWREKTSEQYKKWRWVTYDADLCFRIRKEENVYIGNLYSTSYKESNDEGLYLFNKLISNEEFTTLFLERYLFFVDVVFEKNRVATAVNSIKDQIKSEYIRHSYKWNGQSELVWNKYVEDLIHYNNKRNDVMRDVINVLQNEE